MRILFINTVCGITSTGRICTDLAGKLKEHGHICRIACRSTDDIPEQFKEDAYVIGNKIDVYTHAALSRVFDTSGFHSNRATDHFLKWAEEFDPDILWLHNLHGYYINIEKLFNWIKHRPQMRVKWTLHDCWSFTGHCTYFELSGCEKWKLYCNKCIQKREYPKSLFQDRSKINYEKKKRAFTHVQNMTIITPSKWLKTLVEQSYLKEYPVVCVHNGIDLERFQQVEKSSFKEKYGLQNFKILLCVANGLGKRKGIDEYFSLAERLSKEYKIVLVGVCEEFMNRKHDAILMLPKTSTLDELIEIYSAASVFVNLTLEDNFPTVNLEALACGLPVITYHTGGSPESLSIETGIVVEKHDIDGILNALKVLESNPITVDSCRKRAEDFSIQVAFDNYMELIQL